MRESRTMGPAAFRPARSDSTLEDLRGQLRSFRRRTNATLALRLASLALGGGLLAAASLAALAWNAGRETFLLGFWGVFLVWAGAVGLSALRLARGWIPRRRAALVIDRNLGLSDRLATLDAFPSEERGSGLWPALVADNLRRLDRWDPRRRIPAVVPRTAWIVPLGALAGWLAFYGLPPVPVPLGGRTAPDADDRGLPFRGALEGEGAPSEGSSFFALLPDRIREAFLGGATGAGGTGRGGVPLAGSRPVPGSPPASGEGPAALSPRGGGGESAVPLGPRPAGRAAPPGTAAAGLLRGSGFERMPTVETKPRTDAVLVGRRGAGGGGAGASPGGDGEGPYGESGSRRGAKDLFAFDLAAEARRLPGEAEGERAAPERPAAELAATHDLDDPVRRARVPPEYEPLVRELFARERELHSHGERDKGRSP